MAEATNQTPVSMEAIKADYLLQQNELAARYEEQQAQLRAEAEQMDPEPLPLPFADAPSRAAAPAVDPGVSEFLREHGGGEIPAPFTTLKPRAVPHVEPAPGPSKPRKLRGAPEPPHVQAQRAEPVEPPTLDETATRGEYLCTCGRPDTPGIIHRDNGPCYYPEPPTIDKRARALDFAAGLKAATDYATEGYPPPVSRPSTLDKYRAAARARRESEAEHGEPAPAHWQRRMRSSGPGPSPLLTGIILAALFFAAVCAALIGVIVWLLLR